MISNQILQSTIEGLKNIGRIDLAVMDVEGKEIASTCDMKDCTLRCVEFSKSPADSQEVQGCQYFKIYDEYEAILEKYGKTNGEVEISIRIIREAYETHMRNHTFIEDVRGY